ncbi:MAG: peptidylprolyl isomerase [Acidobacteria bacterium]|nr:peptidylprolyl isomerase [Acidobacteriota bacterium]
MLWSVVGLLIVAGVWYGGRQGIGNTPEASVETSSKSPAPAARPAGDVVIARVNGEAIYKSDYEVALASLPAQAKAIAAKPSGRRLILDEIVKLKLLKQQAEAMGVDKDPEILSQVAAMRDNILAASALEKIVSESPTDLQAFYEKYKNQFRATNVRQILIGYEGSIIPQKPGAEKMSEAQAAVKAAAIVARLRKGEDFATVAKAESDDVKSNEHGGDLGTLRPGQLGPNLEGPIDKLQVNEVSDPVTSPYGVHIFQVTAREVTPFEQVKPALEQQGMNLRAQVVVNAVREGAKIEVEESFFSQQRPQPQVQ